ncbi:antibiotic biosynthesis monooxygenase [Streptomyces sp. MST-110588]|uniref:antibiotic biosynthesis monooxygenase family protein n=1 Tax=Streptomyces sp. MST-110588 TaxID=2833628 RepID=UPI00205121D6|nr:antibiotic biosynthesis monooxygenase [Streptomyces sp. MST-110588]
MGARGQLRVVLYASAPESDPAAVTAAYHRISGELAGTPGLLGNELLRSLARPREYAVVSYWSGAREFRAWEEGAGHRTATAPLRPYQSAADGAFGIYEVIAAYGDGPGGNAGEAQEAEEARESGEARGAAA